MSRYFIILLLLACNKQVQRSPAIIVENTASGKNTYVSKCIRCHNSNPTLPGSLGPDLYGSSLELLTLKTQKREYPIGYKPKRKTRIMPIIKLTEGDLESLHEYINSFKPVN